MSRSKRLGAVVCTLLLYGCASLLVSGDFQSGREALLTNNDERALGYFQGVAEKDPSYVFVSDLFREGIWTYLGRVQYKLGRYEEASQSLERAVSVDGNDDLAKLYLGLTLARRGDDAQGLKEIQAGLQGLYDLLEYMQASRPFTAFWDPQRQ
ncbi:MAG: tetratricopeptide repeat protein, partial [Deltaproteobacteria bacterium]